MLGDERAVRHLATLREAMQHALRTQALTGPVVANSGALIAYLSAELAHMPTERLRILFLNARNRVLRDETFAHGCVSEIPIYPREIMRRSLEVGATALILAHNHPSGDPSPSKGDIDATRRIVAAGRPLDIVVHDHVIVARSGWRSLRALGLLGTN